MIFSSTTRSRLIIAVSSSGVLVLDTKPMASAFAFTSGAFMIFTISALSLRTIGSGTPADIPPGLLRGVTLLEGVLAAAVVLGVWRRWSYGAALLVHVGSVLLLWGQLGDPWGVVLAGLPACGALIALYLLRDRDLWTLDAWLAWRRPWRVVR